MWTLLNFLCPVGGGVGVHKIWWPHPLQMLNTTLQQGSSSGWIFADLSVNLTITYIFQPNVNQFWCDMFRWFCCFTWTHHWLVWPLCCIASQLFAPIHGCHVLSTIITYSSRITYCVIGYSELVSEAFSRLLLSYLPNRSSIDHFLGYDSAVYWHLWPCSYKFQEVYYISFVFPIVVSLCLYSECFDVFV